MFSKKNQDDSLYFCEFIYSKTSTHSKRQHALQRSRLKWECLKSAPNTPLQVGLAYTVIVQSMFSSLVRSARKVSIGLHSRKMPGLPKRTSFQSQTNEKTKLATTRFKTAEIPCIDNSSFQKLIVEKQNYALSMLDLRQPL